MEKIYSTKDLYLCKLGHIKDKFSNWRHTKHESSVEPQGWAVCSKGQSIVAFTEVITGFKCYELQEEVYEEQKGRYVVLVAIKLEFPKNRHFITKTEVKCLISRAERLIFEQQMEQAKKIGLKQANKESCLEK